MNWYLMALRKYADFGGRSRRSEYWYFVLFVVLIGFVPIIGFIVLIVFFVQDGTPGSNAFGPNPKESPASA